jgi:23S rRNA (uracil1939-C5)-methyltransferase
MRHGLERSEGKTIDVRIDSIAAGGDGVGRHRGLVVFVPRTAPGDLARVCAEQDGRLMRGQLLELLEPSPQRTDPPCDHYVIDRCGGCQLQHLLYERQLDAKAGIIHDSLTRIGRLELDKPTVEPSDKPWRYRRKLTLALRHRNGRWIAGLRRYDAPDDVFDLRDCPITQEQVMGDWSSVMEQQKLLPAGRELRAAVRLIPSAFSFTLEGAREWPSHAAFFDAIPRLGELWWKPEGKSRRLLHSRTPNEQAGASFTQVNPGVAASLRQWVVSLATSGQPNTAVDAYAGTGDIALALAEQGTRVTAIEIDRDAARVAASRLPEGSRAIAAAVESALQAALPADVVILNPPRAGVDAKVTQILKAESPKPKAVIYVSCNPATLARDIRRMEAYSVRSLRGFDMFPQTAHVETVCELVPAA